MRTTSWSSLTYLLSYSHSGKIFKMSKEIIFVRKACMRKWMSYQSWAECRGEETEVLPVLRQVSMSPFFIHQQKCPATNFHTLKRESVSMSSFFIHQQKCPVTIVRTLKSVGCGATNVHIEKGIGVHVIFFLHQQKCGATNVQRLKGDSNPGRATERSSKKRCFTRSEFLEISRQSLAR